MSKKLQLLLGLALMAGLTSCKKPVEKVVLQNIKALKTQDVNMFMETIDEKSPVYESTKSQLTELIQNYDLDFEIESMKIIEMPGNEAQAVEKAKSEGVDALGGIEEDDLFINEEDRAKEEARKKEKEAEEASRALVARVKVTQRTKAKKSNVNEFKDNRVTVVHTLHKYPMDAMPEWKIYKSEITSAKFEVKS